MFGALSSLLFAVFLNSCSLGINSVALSTPDTPLQADLSFESLTLGITPVVDTERRVISVNDLPAGRIYSFAVREDGTPSVDFDCTNLPSTARIVENRLHVDFGVTDSTDPVALDCLTSKGALTITLGHEASSLAVVSSSFEESLGSISASAPAQTPDGLFSVWVETGRTSYSANQILIKNHTTGLVRLVSQNASGEVGDASSYSPQITPDGRYVVFLSLSTTLVTGSSGTQVYRKDMQTGIIDLISSTDGSPANRGDAASNYPQITSDGRFTIFLSGASNLVPGSNGQQIYRKDMQTGNIDLVSSTDGSPANRGDASASSYPQMTPDARYVVFQSGASNFVAGSSGQQIFRKDIQTGTIDLVSSTDGSAANRGNNNSTSPQITPDARFVVFSSQATNFVAGSSGIQIFRKDIQTGTIDLISSTDGSAANQGNGSSVSPQITPDARFVVFSSGSINFGTGSSGTQIFRKDLQSGIIDLVSSTDGSAANQGNSYSYAPQITSAGRFVVFRSIATNLVTGSSGYQIFRKDLQTGTIVLVSSTDGSATNRGDGGSSLPKMSSDGRYVVFQSSATNLVAGSSGTQIYRKDLQSGIIDLVSSTDGSAANRGNVYSDSPQMTSDGRYVVFSSQATNFVAGSSGIQIFRKDLQTGTIVLISTTDGSAANRGNGGSDFPQITPDIRYVVFSSLASNFVAGSSGTQIYRKDLQSGIIDLVSSTDGSAANRGDYAGAYPQITADGRYVVFSSQSTNFVAGSSGNQIFRKDLQSGTIDLVSSTDGSAANRGNSGSYYPQITADGRYVVFSSQATNLVAGNIGTQIFRKDLQTGTIVLVSTTDGSAANRGNGSSLYPQMTTDGRFVAFESIATNLVAGSSGQQIYLKEIP